jgi:xanthine dehydrogenase accessory factor
MNLQDLDWPDFGMTDEVRPALARLAAAGQSSVLATLFASEGGSPRGVGTHMLFADGLIVGYLSGGCVEADVALHAEQVLRDGEPQRLVYGRGGPADVQLPCGGRIDILLERLRPDDPALVKLLALSAARRPALWLTDGLSRACLAEGETEVRERLRPGISVAARGEICGVLGQVMARRFDPPQRLAVIGGDPPALAMARLAAEMGMETWLVRPKGPANPPPVAGVRYLRTSLADALREIGLDAWTSVAVASHEPDLDHDALVGALGGGAGYVGVLGSRRKLPQRLARLKAVGVSESDISRLRAPMGLPLAGKSPWEIAVSVLAEVVQAQREREAEQGWRADPPRPEYHVVVLAAGQGARYGGAKLLARLGEATVLDGALTAAFAAPARTVTVVTGAHADEVASAVRKFAAASTGASRLRIVHAADYAEGLSASLRAGLAALPASAAGAFVFLGDMPRTPPGVAAALAYAIGEGKAAAPMHRGRRGHPVLVSRAMFEDLAALRGDQGAGGLLAGLGEALALVEVEDGGVLFDVDSPADLAAAL